MSGLFSQCLLLCSLTVAVCSRWMPGVYFHKWNYSFPNLYCYVPWQSQFVLNGCLFMKLKSSTFPNVYCNVPLQSQFFLDGCLSFMKIDTRTLFLTSTAICLDNRTLFSTDAFDLFSETPGLFSQHLLLCPLTVAVCSRWMPFVYENKHQDSFPNVYCYVPWKSQFVLDGWIAFIFINERTLFPTSTAMSPDSRSLFSMDAWSLWK